MSENLQSPTFIPRAPLDEPAYRIKCYLAGQTIAEVEDDIARMKVLDAADAAHQAVSDRAWRERMATEDAMKVQQAADAAANEKRMRDTNCLWQPSPEDMPKFIVQPESYAQRAARNAAPKNGSK